MSSPRKSLGRSSLSRQFTLIAEQSAKKCERRGGRAETRVVKPKAILNDFLYDNVKRTKNTKRRKSLSKK
jgi:hypothetical protein